MNQLPETRISLILRLGQQSDVQAWQEFAEIYAPVLYGLAIRKGLQPSDAEDVTQEILFGVAKAVERFEPDPERASFRTWLSRIARNRIVDFLRQRIRLSEYQVSEFEVNELQAGTLDSDTDFQSEYQAALFERASRQVRSRVSEQTWEAFYETSALGQDPSQVAAKLQMRLGTVYVARSRVMKMIREEVQRLEGTYDLNQRSVAEQNKFQKLSMGESEKKSAEQEVQQ